MLHALRWIVKVNWALMHAAYFVMKHVCKQTCELRPFLMTWTLMKLLQEIKKNGNDLIENAKPIVTHVMDTLALDKI